LTRPGKGLESRPSADLVRRTMARGNGLLERLNGDTTMFTELAVRVGFAYVGAIVALTLVLHLLA